MFCLYLLLEAGKFAAQLCDIFSVSTRACASRTVLFSNKGVESTDIYDLSLNLNKFQRVRSFICHRTSIVWKILHTTVKFATNCMALFYSFSHYIEQCGMCVTSVYENNFFNGPSAPYLKSSVLKT